MKNLIPLIVICACKLLIPNAYSQCSDDNVIVSSVDFSSSTPGNFAPFIGTIDAGDKITMDICAGAAYTVTMCDNNGPFVDPQLTVTTLGGTVIVSNDDHCGTLPQVSWVSSFTGSIEILIDDFDCSHTETSMSLTIYSNSNCGAGTASTGCSPNIGTFTATHNATPVTPGVDDIYLCGSATDCLDFLSNDDYILPSPASNNNYEVSELGYLIYTCTPPAIPDPSTDICFSGFLSIGEDITQCGNSTDPVIYGSSDLWYVPITMDDGDDAGNPNATHHWDQDGDGCYVIGTELHVIYLSPISLGTPAENCDNGVVTIKVNGGLPQHDGGATNYTVTNNASGSVISGAIINNGYVVLNGLTNGDTYDITVSDGVSCFANISGTYISCSCPTASFTGIPTTMNCNDASVNLMADAAVVPCYEVLVLPSNSVTGNTIQAFSDGIALGGGPTTISTDTIITQTYTNVSPSSVNTLELCETTVGSDMTYLVVDCHSGNLITSGTWTSDGSCQTITVTPPGSNINSTSTWGGNGSSGLITTDYGFAIFDPSAVGAGTWNIDYYWDGGNGCKDTSTVSVTVNDPTPPTLTCNGNISVNNDVGTCSASVVTTNPIMSDNCVIQSLTWATTGADSDNSPPTGINYVGTRTFPVGTTTITYTASDGVNSTTCAYTVTVSDTSPPTVLCQNATVYLNLSGMVTLTVADVDGGSIDNCSGLTLSINKTSFSCSDLGTNTVTITATDANLNTSSCTANVMVLDTNNRTGVDTRTECDSLVWIDGNTYYSNNNTATFNIVSGAASMCDSLVTLDLTINNSTTGIDTRTECDSLVWIDGNTYYSDNNTATFNIVGAAANMCDSLVTLDLTINNSTTGTDTRTECDSLLWIDGNTYYSNNNTATFNIVGAAANMCDSLVTLNLTINNSATGTDTRTECDSLVWIDGNTYYSNNNTATFNIVGSATNMCDSLVTLNLTINNSTTGTDTRTECDSLVWIDGNTYYSNNNTATFNIVGAAANMCDSLVTLDLTINNSTTGTDTRTECDSLVWIDGNTYYSNNNTATFNIVGAAANMCDSLVTLDLTVSNSGTDTRTECDSLVWIDGNTYYSNNNSATFNIINGSVNGCDSLVTLDLTINSVSDLTTTVSGITITANNTSATYQWLDCDNSNEIISSETNNFFSAVMNGNYAVELTENGCIDTSACASITSVGILENNFGNEFKLYPNPTDGNFSIDLGNNYQTTVITITDLNGRTIQSKKYTDSQLLNLKLKEPTGIYLLIVESESKKAVIRLVKE